jgi:membrane-associated phospholipid phosphatase
MGRFESSAGAPSMPRPLLQAPHLAVRNLLRLLRNAELRWAAVMLAMFGALAAAVTHSATVTRLDTEASVAMHANTSHEATEWNLLVTHFGSTEFAVTLTVLAVLILAVLRHWHGALAVAVSVATTQAVVQIIKLTMSRPRPGTSVIDAHGFSFPSAHAATSVALYLTVALIAARASRGALRVAIVGGTTALLLAVGASRVYLGAHYPSDVVAGWLTGAILVMGTSFAVARFRRPAGHLV